MKRGYTALEFKDKVRRLRAARADICISTDFIVGFPGESDAEFEATRAYMERSRFDSAFLFKYSARPDTRSFKLPETVDEAEKGRRLSTLLEQQQQISGEIHDSFLGREVEVLVDGPSTRGKSGARPPQLHGKSSEFKTVVWADDGAAPGTLQRLRVVGSTPVTLLGEPVSVPRAEPLVTLEG
jgi:tRNA-2-methylthio-N6-dimethylallyladenosine synthase